MQKIQDYGLIGNSRSAALISKEGSLDWLCWPRFDSPSLFAAILDREVGGYWKIAPLLPAAVEREYVADTNVLKTTFRTDAGTVVLTDFMPVLSEEEKAKKLYPEQEMIRYIECISGSVEVGIIYQPRPNYARSPTVLKDKGRLGLRIEGECLFSLHSLCTFHIENHTGYCTLKLKQGEAHAFSLTCHYRGPASIPSIERQCVVEKLNQSISWWQNWVKCIDYEGEYRQQVVRSALSLKLLYYAPSGTFIAAPTTSLPERVGGDLNWDYRFSWLRDAAFVVQALYGLKMYDEAEPFISWLLYSTKLSISPISVLFDVYGRYCGREAILDHLKGYQNSTPVRIGNAASTQFQLDVYGEVVEAASLFIKHGGPVSLSFTNELLKFGKYICKHWKKPDNGIWEYREGMHIHTYSLLMCWVALDRILQMHAHIKLRPKLFELFQRTREAIRDTIENQCWNSEIGSYATAFEGKEVGVSLLQLAIRGFEKADSFRMATTYKMIRDKLLKEHSLFYRNEIAIKKGEGSFHMCNFWNIEYLAAGGGTLEQAKEAFVQTLSYANDVGLFSEEIDPETKDALGNFPQALSHAGLINAAVAIKKREEGEKPLCI